MDYFDQEICTELCYGLLYGSEIHNGGSFN